MPNLCPIDFENQSKSYHKLTFDWVWIKKSKFKIGINSGMCCHKDHLKQGTVKHGVDMDKLFYPDFFIEAHMHHMWWLMIHIYNFASVVGNTAVKHKSI